MQQPLLPAYGPFPCFPAVPMTAKELKEYDMVERSKVPDALM